MKKNIFSLLALLLCCVSFGCNDEKESSVARPVETKAPRQLVQASQLQGTWTVKTIVDNGTSYDLLTSNTLEPITMIVDQETIEKKESSFEIQVSGCAGINLYRGPIIIEKNKIKGGLFATTMMAGPESAMHLEQTYLKLLTAGGTFNIKPLDGKQVLTIENPQTNSKIIMEKQDK